MQLGADDAFDPPTDEREDGSLLCSLAGDSAAFVGDVCSASLMGDFETLLWSVKLEDGDLLSLSECLLSSCFALLDSGISLSFNFSLTSSFRDDIILDCAFI